MREILLDQIEIRPDKNLQVIASFKWDFVQEMKTRITVAKVCLEK